MFALQKIGYHPQKVVLADVKKWKKRKLLAHFELLCEISKELLKPSCEGHSMEDYKSVTWHFGPLPVNDQIKLIRRQTIDIQKELYLISKEPSHKKKVLQTLYAAIQTPHEGNYGDDLLGMIVADATFLIEYYIKILPAADNRVIKGIEEQTQWLHRSFGLEKLPKLGQLRSLIASNTEYSMFRVFVGHDFRFSSDWQAAQQERKQRIQGFVDEISERTFKQWQKRIQSVADKYSSVDSSEFQYFSVFLFELGMQKPLVARDLITHDEKTLEPFLIHLVAGIWKSASPLVARSIINNWLKEDKHLSLCAYLFDYVQEVHHDLLKKIVKKAVETNDSTALQNAVGSIARTYCKSLKPLFLRIVKELTRKENTSWVGNVWYRGETIFVSLSGRECQIILDNLKSASSIGHEIEELLAFLADRHPLRVIRFLEKRVSIQSKKERVKYDAIPYHLFEAHTSLQKRAAVVVPEILTWFSKKAWLFHWEAAHLLQKIFPSFDPILESSLINLVSRGGNTNAKIVLFTLRAYQGQLFLHKVCKEFVKRYLTNESFRHDIFIMLSQAGVVTGEYGLMEAYKRKKEEIQEWKQDPSEAIQLFVKEYESYLDQRILHEQKTVDEEVELMKRGLR